MQHDTDDVATFLTRFDEHADRRLGDVLLTADNDQELTFGDVQSGSRRLAASLRRLGLRPGDRVAVHAFNIPEVVVAFLGCLRAGCIVVPLNTRLKADEIRVICDVACPKLYIGQRELVEGLSGCEGLPDDMRYVFDAKDGEEEAKPWAQLLEPPPGEDPQPVVRRAADPAFLLSTSGTTGKPKLVIWTDRTLTEIADVYRDEELLADDVIMQQMPMMHAGGLLQVACALSYGARLVLVAKFDENAVLDALQHGRCTAILATPSMYTALVHAQEQAPRDLGALRLCVSAGDVCPPRIEEAVQRLFGRPLYSRWGATEDVATSRHGCEPGPFIRPVRRDAWRLVDDDGADVDAGGTGELWTCSSGTSPGYWRKDGSLDPLPDGWFHSGDRAQWDGGDQLRFMGRDKDLIIRAGSNISPLEVEAALAGCPGVKEAAVVGVADDELGQKVAAVLVLESGTEAEGVVTCVRGALADYKAPEIYRLVEALPRNSLGKIERRELAPDDVEWLSA